MTTQLNVSLFPYQKKGHTIKKRYAMAEELGISELSGRNFTFNGSKEIKPFIYKNIGDIENAKNGQQGNVKTAYGTFCGFAQENKIKDSGIEWNTLVTIMGKEGLFRCTELVIEKIARHNASIFKQEIDLEFQYDISQSTSLALTITETLVVKQRSTQEVCAKFNTRSVIDAHNIRPDKAFANIRYKGTSVDINSPFGKKIFPDTRSVLRKVQEYIVALLCKIVNHQAPYSKFNLFCMEKALSECSKKPIPDSQPLTCT